MNRFCWTAVCVGVPIMDTGSVAAHISVSAPAGAPKPSAAPTVVTAVAKASRARIARLCLRHRTQTPLISVAARCGLDGTELGRPSRTPNLGSESMGRHRLHLGQQR